MGEPLGQNFLIDKNIAEKIIEAADLNERDDVIEIGPGRGVLTGLIAPKVRSLVCIELDRRLSEKLKEKFKACGNVTVINQNFLDYNIPPEQKNIKIIANLPYYVATKIIQTILPQKVWHKAVFMVQKEVGQRIVAETDRSSYGFLSIFCQYYAHCKALFTCSPKVFYPEPEVDSIVLEFTNKHSPRPDEELFKVIKLSFSQKRKTILNSLSNALGCEKPLILDVLKQAEIQPNLRSENLSIKSFQNLTFLLKKCKILQ